MREATESDGGFYMHPKESRGTFERKLLVVGVCAVSDGTLCYAAEVIENGEAIYKLYKKNDVKPLTTKTLMDAVFKLF